jgi:hypothetical protein
MSAEGFSSPLPNHFRISSKIMFLPFGIKFGTYDLILFYFNNAMIQGQKKNFKGIRE